jgi:hypothetical protein
MPETFVQSTDDVVAFLKGQHNLIKDMFDDVLYASEPKAREKAFVDLRQLLAVHELKSMAAAVRAAEAIAPTRPHPGVESAKLNFAVGPFASMLDRARDAIGAALR